MEENNQEDNVLRELFEIWAEKTVDLALLDRTTRLCRLIPDRTEDCMKPNQLRAYASEDAKTLEQFKEHYDACSKYCQKAVSIYKEAKK